MGAGEYDAPRDPDHGEEDNASEQKHAGIADDLPCIAFADAPVDEGDRKQDAEDDGGQKHQGICGQHLLPEVLP